MNYTQNKLNLKTFFALLLVVLFANESVFAKRAAGADMAMAERSFAPAPPQQPYPVSETISYYTKKQSTQKLSQNETDILSLSRLAQDVFEIKDFKVYAYFKTEQEKVASISLSYVAGMIQQAIEKKSDWDEPLSSANLEKVKTNSELLKNVLTDTSYSWAWISYQKGQKQEAKKILSTKFEDTYAHVMKLRHTYSHRSSPLEEAERSAKTLQQMSSDDENKTREDQLKKMRTHISTLPDVQIMT